MDSTKFGKDFFHIDDQLLWNQQENIEELHRRVGVFTDALTKFDSIHHTFKDAFQWTLYSVLSKNEYIKQWARWYLAELLYWNSEQLLLNMDEKDKVKKKLNDLLQNDWLTSLDTLKQVIKKQLFLFLDIGYPELKINKEGIYQEITNFDEILKLIDFRNVANYTPRIDFIWNNMTKDIKCINLLYDISVLKKKYLYVSHQLYVWEADRIHHLSQLDDIRGREWILTYEYSDCNEICREVNRNISLTQFESTLTKLQQELILMQEIEYDEWVLRWVLEQIETSEISDSQIEKLRDCIQAHINKYDLYLEKKELIRRDENRAPKIEYNKVYDERQCRGYDAKNLVYNLWEVYYQSDRLQSIISEYDLIWYMQIFDKEIWRVDTIQLQKDKKQFGAKWAYLNALSDLFKRFNVYDKKCEDMVNNEDPDCEIRERTFAVRNYMISIPEYELCATDSYIYWKNNGKIDPTVKGALYNIWKNKWPIIIRSSTVYSEDNDETTWAWIYKSLILEKVTKVWLEKIMIEIYESCDSRDALAYREINGILNEEMWLIIQQYIPNDDWWYVNSLVPHRPELLEVVFTTSSNDLRALYKKEWMQSNAFLRLGSDKTHMFYNIDTGIYDNEKVRSANKLAYLSILLERFFQKHIQSEFVCEIMKKKFERSNLEYISDYVIHLVQSRPLPDILAEPLIVNFPEKIPVREWKATWVCDQILTVLTSGENNNKKEWFVSFENNYFASRSDFVVRSLPSQWAVVIRNEVKSTGLYRQSWHIETLSVEKRIPCLSPNSRTQEPIMEETWRKWDSWHRADSEFTEFYWYKKVRVVADWLVWKVYGIDEEE
jgi:hypothetical protein